VRSAHTGHDNGQGSVSYRFLEAAEAQRPRLFLSLVKSGGLPLSSCKGKSTQSDESHTGRQTSIHSEMDCKQSSASLDSLCMRSIEPLLLAVRQCSRRRLLMRARQSTPSVRMPALKAGFHFLETCVQPWQAVFSCCPFSFSDVLCGLRRRLVCS